MLQAVADILRNHGVEGWLVGGSVRDRELGRRSPDVDVVVAGDAAAVAEALATALKAPWFALSERHLTYRVIGRGGHVDVAAARGGGILQDLAERDFTVNAMALPIRPVPAAAGRTEAEPVDRDALIDPFDGLTHLRDRRLAAVSHRIFADDPLRLMRAARFCHVLGFELYGGLEDSIRSQAPELARTAGERIAAEMVLTLAEGRSAEAARLWHDLGLLEVVLPEVCDRSGLAAVLATLERLDDLLARLMVWFPATADVLDERLRRPVDGAVERPVAMRMAGLTHRLESDPAEAVARRLKLSGDMISLLRTVAGCLGEGGENDRLGFEGDFMAPSEARRLDRAEVLFLWGAAPFEPEVVLLAAAAGIGSVLPSTAGRMMALWAERSLRGVPRPPVDGDLLMRELGVESGPLLGKTLREVRLVWEMRETTTISGLLDVARGVVRQDQRTR